MVGLKRSRAPRVQLFRWMVISASIMEHCWRNEDVIEFSKQVAVFAPALCGYLPDDGRLMPLSGLICGQCREIRNRR